jgi:hypothetical protein
MNFFNSKNKFFLDMSELRTLSHSVVLVDKVFSSLKLKPNQTAQIQIQNPFTNLANLLALKSVFKKPVVELPFGNPFHREFEAGNFAVIYDQFPPRFEIKDKNPDIKNLNLVRDIASELITFSEVEKDAGALGINYEMFLAEDNLDLRKFLLKQDIAEGFTSLSATPVFKVDEVTTLNLTIAAAINDDNKDGIFFGVNFHTTLDGSRKISDILKDDFYKIAKEKIKMVFKELIEE